MALDASIAFLGAGNMAGALIQGLIGQGTCAPSQITASDPRPEALQTLAESHGVHVTSDNALAAKADVVVLSVKPQVFPTLLEEIAGELRPDACVLSIAAGIPLSVIEDRLGHDARVVRAMPNMPALVGAGATGIAAGKNATEADLAIARQIFESVGVTITVDESLIDAVTGLSGSGPAYVFLFVESLVEAGVAVGLSEQDAATLAGQTVLGAAKLLEQSGELPASLRQKVSSPGGTTLAGLERLQERDLKGALLDAVEHATARAHELGEEAREKPK